MHFIWKTYLLPIIDYCSQLYGPNSGAGLMKLENLQKAFTAKISGIGHLPYWDRLKEIKLYNINRRIERYKIIYSHKIMSGTVHNCGLSWKNNSTSGLLFDMCGVKEYAKSLREQSFLYIGPRLHNILPRYMRDNISASSNEWKVSLDELLQLIPDTPIITEAVPGLCNHNSQPTNSIVYWIPHLHLDDRRGSHPRS